MAATPPSDSKPAGDDRNLVAANETAALSFEDRVNAFWQANRGLVVGACVAVVVLIVGKGVWDYISRERELDLERAYAAATTPEQLKAFAAAHSSHMLGALAQLRIADDAYAAGKAADALAGYEKAIGMLKEPALVGRARIGRAMAKVQAGKTAEGTDELKQLSNDPNQLKAVRTEAAYQLASLAADVGNAADVQRLSDELMKIDPTSPWVSRAMSLRASMPATAANAAPAGAPPAAKKDESSSFEVKLPGKK
ncbi:MAG: tetratricopeptide repeat protein [Opitutaceae bacterium]|nr:tetratricopeptide repeat protein [Opitutaceae bacterium]